MMNMVNQPYEFVKSGMVGVNSIYSELSLTNVLVSARAPRQNHSLLACSPMRRPAIRLKQLNGLQDQCLPVALTQ